MANVTRRQPASFPAGLQCAPAEEKLKFFSEVVIGHDLFDEKMQEIDYHVQSRLKGTMIMLVGPSGVGKTSMGDTACSTINKGFFTRFPDDLHTIPAASIEAWAPENEKFDWTDFYEQLLAVLQVPLIEATLPEVKRVIAGREMWLPMLSNGGRPNLRDLRKRLRRAVTDRRPSMLFVDEASNILVAPKDKRIKRQANTLRSIVNKVDTLLVLSGAYDLYDLVLQTGQLARRGQIVHMRGYLKSEEKSFCKALIALQNAMPLEMPCSLMDHADLLAEQSLRTVGHLKYILLRVLRDHYMSKRPIDEEMLRRACYKPAQLEVMRIEMYDGYKKVEQCRHPDDRRTVHDTSSGSNTNDDNVLESGRRKRIGKPKPSRGAIG